MTLYIGSQAERLLAHYLPAEKQDELGVKLVTHLHYRDVSDAPLSRYADLRELIDDAQKEKTKALLFFLRIDSPSGAKDPAFGLLMGHVVALKIDLENKRIIYQDPQGHDMLAETRSDLNGLLPEFPIRELKVIQQAPDNHTDCGTLVVENLQWLATSDEVETNPNIPHLRAKHAADLTRQDTHATSR